MQSELLEQYQFFENYSCGRYRRVINLQKLQIEIERCHDNF